MSRFILISFEPDSSFLVKKKNGNFYWQKVRVTLVKMNELAQGKLQHCTVQYSTVQYCIKYNTVQDRHIVYTASVYCVLV